MGQTAGHAALGGAIAEVQGDSFQSGALAAGLSALFAPGINKIGGGSMAIEYEAARVAASAAIGGTAAELGGGKFANGAVTAAFMRLYNEESGRTLERGRSRGLTGGERKLAASIFGDEINYGKVRIVRAVGIWGQPADRAMSLRGRIYFHPSDPGYSDDFSTADIDAQADFIHEMTHVWQHQKGRSLVLGKIFHGGYKYVVQPERPFARYGIEQQASIVEHYFTLSKGYMEPGQIYRPLEWYKNTIPFGK